MISEVLNEVVNIDTNLFLSINRMHSPFFDYFMRLLVVNGFGCLCMLPFGM